MSGETEIKVTVERLGGRVGRTGEAKRITQIEAVDDEGTIRKTTEVEQNVHDCDHAGESGGACSVCGEFTVCAACAKEARFACTSCQRVACPACARESLLQPGVRICRRCGLMGLLRATLAGRK